MKAFSKSWKSSKKPRKQRKYTYNAPLHLKRKLVKAKVSKEIEEKYNVKTLIVRKNDKVKILRGEYKGKEGKVIGFSKKDYRKVLIEGIELTKKAGEKKHIPIHHSNLLIISAEEDPKRFKRKKTTAEKTVKETKKKTEKTENKKTETAEKKESKKVEEKTTTEEKKENKNESKEEVKETKKEQSKSSDSQKTNEEKSQ